MTYTTIAYGGDTQVLEILFQGSKYTYTISTPYVEISKLRSINYRISFWILISSF